MRSVGPKKRWLLCLVVGNELGVKKMNVRFGSRWSENGLNTPKSESREGAQNFLGRWIGKLVCDDFAIYKAGLEKGITEIGCIAHANRKFFDMRVANKSPLAEQALYSIGGLYIVERQVRDISDEDHWRIR